MNLTLHKCVVNVIPVTNPTQYTKLVKEIVKNEIRLLLGIPISRISHENSPYGLPVIRHAYIQACHTCICKCMHALPDLHAHAMHAYVDVDMQVDQYGINRASI